MDIFWNYTFTKCSSRYYSGILIFETTKGMENWFAESKVKVKMKCLTKKGNNLGCELSRVSNHHDSTIQRSRFYHTKFT